MRGGGGVGGGGGARAGRVGRGRSFPSLTSSCAAFASHILLTVLFASVFFALAKH